MFYWMCSSPLVKKNIFSSGKMTNIRCASLHAAWLSRQRRFSELIIYLVCFHLMFVIVSHFHSVY